MERKDIYKMLISVTFQIEDYISHASNLTTF